MQKRHAAAPPVLARPLREGRRRSGLVACGTSLILGLTLDPVVSLFVEPSAVIETAFTVAASALLFFLGARAKLVHRKEDLAHIRADYQRLAASGVVVLAVLLSAGVDFKSALLFSVLAGVAVVGPTVVSSPHERLHVLIAVAGVLLLPAGGAGESVIGIIGGALFFLGAGIVVLLVGQFRYTALAGALLRRMPPIISLSFLAGVIAAAVLLGISAGIAAPLSAFLGGLLIRRCPFSTSIFVDTLRVRTVAGTAFLFATGLLLEASQIGPAAATAAGLYILHRLISRLFRPQRSAEVNDEPSPGLTAFLWLSTLYAGAHTYELEWGFVFTVGALLLSISGVAGVITRRVRREGFADFAAHRDHASLLGRGADVTGLRLMEVVSGSAMDGARLRSTSFWPEFRVYVHTVWRGDAALELKDGLTVRAGDSVLLSGTPERLISLAPLFECSFINPPPGV